MIVPPLLVLVQAASPLAVVDDRMRPDQDILSYAIALSLGDTAIGLSARVTIRYVVVGGHGPLSLDFDSALTVDSITTPTGRLQHAQPPRRGAAVPPREWRFQGSVLEVPQWGNPGDTLEATVFYRGHPRDGLRFQRNQYDDPTVFADNWPNRAHFWLPCNDHPSDKALVAFTVDVPRGWRAVANGRLERVDTVAAGRTRWIWRSDHPLSTYSMVVGAGRLAITTLPTLSGVPQTLWTFPQDSAFAVQVPFRRATLMVEAFTQLMGSYPYAKLAHVESSTQFGAMENSSAIFYAQRPFLERTMTEETVAHETAHQWFGDAVTERDWHHLWLSEGFASYLGPLFFELAKEPDRFRDAMERNRRVYMASSVVDRPIIDTAQHRLTLLLNENNYPKAAWVLHMLRREVGDSTFFAGLKGFYETYRDTTALSTDFARVVERTAGRPLAWFFEQWLLQPGYPRLAVSWTFADGELTMEIEQTQPAEWGRYRLLLPVELRLESGESERIAVPVPAATKTVFRRRLASAPTGVTPDPDGTLLAETEVSSR